MARLRDQRAGARDASWSAIERAGFVPGEQVAIALDIAASEFGRGRPLHAGPRAAELDCDGLIELLLRWIEPYPIVSIEDPLAEDDAAAFARFTRRPATALQIVGDDLLVSRRGARAPGRRAARPTRCCSSPTSAARSPRRCEPGRPPRRLGYAGIVSARSGETEDTTIVHLAIGWGVGQLKVGSFARSERMAKWNEALRIEERLGARARFAGTAAFGRTR